MHKKQKQNIYKFVKEKLILWVKGLGTTATDMILKLSRILPVHESDLFRLLTCPIGKK